MSLVRSFAIALAALSCSSTVASAQAGDAPARLDMIDALDAICVVAEGDTARVAALAAEAGFSPVPSEMVPALRNSTETAGFVRSNATDMAFVMTGKMTRRIGRETVAMPFCGIGARPTDHRALDAGLREAMGFAPVKDGGMEAYGWLQTAEGRAPTRSLSDAQFISMARTGQMRLVALDRQGPGSLLLYILPRLD